MKLTHSCTSLTSLSNSSYSDCKSPVQNSCNRYEWEMIYENEIIELFKKITKFNQELGCPILDKCTLRDFFDFAYKYSNVILIETCRSPTFLDDYDTEESIED